MNKIILNLKLKPTEVEDVTRFYPMDLEDSCKFDLIQAILNDEMIGIVDEEAGGIIGYAIGQQHADMMFIALNQAIDLNVDKDTILNLESGDVTEIKEDF